MTGSKECSQAKTETTADFGHVFYRQEVWLQTTMCSTDRKCGYREQCALHRKCGYRQKVKLQRGSVATDSNVLYRKEVWLQTGSVATDSNVLYRQEVKLQTAMCSTDIKCGDSLATWL